MANTSLLAANAAAASALNGTDLVQCKMSEGNAIHVVGTFIAVIIIIENALVLMAIAMKRKLFGMVFFVFVQSLAISDLLSGVIFMYTFLFNDLLSLDNASMISWTLRKSSIISSLIISVASLELISVDRYISVAWPLSHDKIMTRKRAMLLVMLAWLIGLILVVAPAVGWNCGSDCVCLTATIDGSPNCPGAGCSRIYPPLTNNYIITVVCIFVMLTIGICYCNAAVFWKVKLHFKRMAKTRTSSTKTKKDEKELAVFMATVFIIFMLCWLPSVILLTIDATSPDVQISDDAFDMCSMPALLNSLINPWLYAIKLRTCRRVLVNWLCKCVKKPKRYEIFRISRSVVPVSPPSGSVSSRTHITRCSTMTANPAKAALIANPVKAALIVVPTTVNQEAAKHEEEEALNPQTPTQEGSVKRCRLASSECD